jgi:hypothetical protein
VWFRGGRVKERKKRKCNIMKSRVVWHARGDGKRNQERQEHNRERDREGNRKRNRENRERNREMRER